MLGVARYRLEGNFIPFFNLRDDKGWGTGNLTYTVIPLGLLGLPLSDVTEWNQTLKLLRLPGLKIGDEQHTTPVLGRNLQNFALTNRSFRDFPLRYDMREAPKRFLLAVVGFV